MGIPVGHSKIIEEWHARARSTSGEDADNEVPEAAAAAAEADAIEAEEVQALLATPGIDDGTSAEDQEPSSDDEQLSNDDDDEDEMECDFPPPAAPPSVTRTHVAGAYNEFERLTASRQFERVQGSVHYSVHCRMSRLLERVHKQKKRASRGGSKNLRVSRVRITGEPPSEMLMEAMHSRILEVEGHRATHDAFSQGVIAPVCMPEVTGGTTRRRKSRQEARKRKHDDDCLDDCAQPPPPPPPPSGTRR